MSVATSGRPCIGSQTGSFAIVAGHCIYECGFVAAKNSKHVLFKNFLTISLSGMTWYFLGYGLSFGQSETESTFVGNANVAQIDWDVGTCQYTVHGCLCALASILIHGAWTERCHSSAYLLMSLEMAVLIYPLALHWSLSPAGWLAKGRSTHDVGVVDIGGAASLHISAGIVALCGAMFLGPRMGRFTVSTQHHVKQTGMQNPQLAMVGFMIAWMGWYACVIGSVSPLHANYGPLVGRGFATTFMSSSTSAILGALIAYHRHRQYSLEITAKCLLAGIVAASAGSCVINPYNGVPIGVVAASVYHGVRILMLRFQIDDPMEISAVHGAVGAWGIIVPGLFANPNYLRELKGQEIKVGGGVFMGENGDLLSIQLISLTVQLAWTAGLALPSLFILERADRLKLEMDMEIAGMDATFHDGVSCNISSSIRQENHQHVAMPLIDAGALTLNDSATTPIAAPGWDQSQDESFSNQDGPNSSTKGELRDIGANGGQQHASTGDVASPHRAQVEAELTFAQDAQKPASGQPVKSALKRPGSFRKPTSQTVNRSDDESEEFGAGLA